MYSLWRLDVECGNVALSKNGFACCTAKVKYQGLDHEVDQKVSVAQQCWELVELVVVSIVMV